MLFLQRSSGSPTQEKQLCPRASWHTDKDEEDFGATIVLFQRYKYLYWTGRFALCLPLIRRAECFRHEAPLYLGPTHNGRPASVSELSADAATHVSLPD